MSPERLAELCRAYPEGGLLGLPWERGAQGPEAWDCWALARKVLADGFGIDVPIILPALSRGARVRQHEEYARSGPWRHGIALADAEPGDLVLMSPGTGRMEHVGVWLGFDGGGVLHASEGPGVAFHRPGALRALWQVVEVVRYAQA